MARARSGRRVKTRGEGFRRERGKEGKGAEMMDGGPGGAGTWNYGAPPPQMQHRVQQGGMVYHQRNPSSHRMMTQQQHMGSILRVVLGVDDDQRELRRRWPRERGDDDAPVLHEPERRGPERRPDPRARAQPHERHVRGGGWAGGARGDHREARQGDVAQHQGEPVPFGAFGGGAPGRARRRRAAVGTAQQPSDKAQSGVDRCVANLLYHRYPDAPAETPDAFQEGGQSQQMDGAGDVRKRTRCLGRRAGGDERHSRQARLGVRFEPSQRVVAT